MPGRTSSTYRPSRRRTTNPVSASPARSQSKTSRRRSSWGDSCLWPQARSATASLVNTGSDRAPVPTALQALHTISAIDCDYQTQTYSLRCR